MDKVTSDDVNKNVEIERAVTRLLGCPGVTGTKIERGDTSDRDIVSFNFSMSFSADDIDNPHDAKDEGVHLLKTAFAKIGVRTFGDPNRDDMEQNILGKITYQIRYGVHFHFEDLDKVLRYRPVIERQ